MALTTVVFAALLSTVSLAHGFVGFGDMPPELEECLYNYTNHTVSLSQGPDTHPAMVRDDKVYMECLQKFMWKTDQIRWSDFNITEEDLAWANSLLMPMHQSRRSKRQAGPNGFFPPSGFRVRREYRRMADGERAAFHMAMNMLKQSGQYDTLANIHRGVVVTSAHGGPNFFGWHRVYLCILVTTREDFSDRVEEALRRIDRRVAIPYWDSTLDFDMDNPADSVIWSPRFLGNGDGFVTSGPFADWMVAGTSLTRNIGGTSRLMSKEVIRAIMTRCRTAEISEPNAVDEFNLEFHHGGPHNWVGGHMSGLNTAGHDPVFFLHHAFIDYIWERFRVQQARRCRVNPTRDYPPAMGLHAPGRPMDGFPRYRAIDGYRRYWTRFWYRYERAPFCSPFRPFCGTPYLRCDAIRGRCVSVPRLVPTRTTVGGIAGAQPSTIPLLAANNARRASMQEASIAIGPRFRAPPPERRTQAAMMAGIGPMRFRRNARRAVTAESSSAVLPSFSPTFRAPPSNGRTSDILGRSVASGTITSGTLRQLSFPYSPPMPLLPSVDGAELSSANSPISLSSENNYWPPIYNSSINVKEMVFIPTKVSYEGSLDINRALKSLNLPGSAVQPRCGVNTTKPIRVNVYSQGLNYVGSHTNHVFVDSSRPKSSAITYLGVKEPETGSSDVLVSAFDECGNACQPECISNDVKPFKYQPCSGVLLVTSDKPKMYSQTAKDALTVVWKKPRAGIIQNVEGVRILFKCSSF